MNGNARNSFAAVILCVMLLLIPATAAGSLYSADLAALRGTYTADDVVSFPFSDYTQEQAVFQNIGGLKETYNFGTAIGPMSSITLTYTGTVVQLPVWRDAGGGLHQERIPMAFGWGFKHVDNEGTTGSGGWGLGVNNQYGAVSFSDAYGSQYLETFPDNQFIVRYERVDSGFAWDYLKNGAPSGIAIVSCGFYLDDGSGIYQGMVLDQPGIINVTNVNLTINEQVPVPVPAAVWLLGPGIVCLVRFKRKAREK